VWTSVLLGATAVNCIVQIAWFCKFHWRNITTDGINYIGLARHLLDGNFKASVHGYWSPLISWIIAAGGLLSQNFTLVGRIVTITSFLLCLPLLYLLTLRLWRSRAAAALAVLWFSCARGLIAGAVEMIVADFLLTACVLLYFILLLGSLRENSARSWTQLGGAHALAFLAKAISMPWLAISSAIALFAQNRRALRRVLASLPLVFLIPAVAWTGWGLALRAKYGEFTTGYQLRANLMVNWQRHLSGHMRGDSVAFANFPSLYDNYMVSEPWPGVRRFSLNNPTLPSMMVATEARNLPPAVKETVILLTPAGALALPFTLWLLLRDRNRYSVEAVFAGIASLSATVLIAAYCMLVFDGRYIIPIAPILIAVCCPLLLPVRLSPDAPHLKPWLQRLGLGLLAASLVFFAVYWASPFRTASRDYEVSCYEAANTLRQSAPSGTLASIGEGPYPEHGVGFEVGSYVSYMAGWRLIAGNAGLPLPSQAKTLADEALATHADAVAVWGSPTNPTYGAIISQLKTAPGLSSFRPFSDPHKGEVGTVFVFIPHRQ
jgi:4-amino-4-deoxy-L-arabinose transferase-like glycosyltransferase